MNQESAAKLAGKWSNPELDGEDEPDYVHSVNALSAAMSTLSEVLESVQNGRARGHGLGDHGANMESVHNILKGIRLEMDQNVKQINDAKQDEDEAMADQALIGSAHSTPNDIRSSFDLLLSPQPIRKKDEALDLEAAQQNAAEHIEQSMQGTVGEIEKSKSKEIKSRILVIPDEDTIDDPEQHQNPHFIVEDTKNLKSPRFAPIKEHPFSLQHGIQSSTLSAHHNRQRAAALSNQQIFEFVKGLLSEETNVNDAASLGTADRFKFDLKQFARGWLNEHDHDGKVIDDI